MRFELFVGIDYSGAETPESRLKGLQVYTARPGELPQKQRSRAPSNNGQPCNWTRKEIAEWLIELAQQGVRYIAGIDHGFSFPQSYFDRYKLTSWPQFLDDFTHHWPTDREHTYVDFCRDPVPRPWPDWPGPGLRVGTTNEFRLCEKWTSSAKSVFQFGVQGSVAHSTHAGIPWLRRIRQACGNRVHVWPFDGWQLPASGAVIAEVYPSIFRKRYCHEGGTSTDEQDAYAVTRWLSETEALGALERYANPPLSASERQEADIEGWILGVG